MFRITKFIKIFLVKIFLILEGSPVSLKVKIADFADLKDIAELQATIKSHFENSLDKEKPSVVEIVISTENSVMEQQY